MLQNLLIFLAQTTSTSSDAGGGAASLVILCCTLIFIIIFVVAPMWIIFSKAGRPGWAALIPIYNQLVLLQIVGLPIWVFFLFFIPLANLIAVFLVTFSLAKSFGQSEFYGCGILLLPFIFIPLLAFGPARYVGPRPAIGG